MAAVSKIHLKGPGLNNFFAEEMVALYGAEGARERSSGEMLAAVERVIARRKKAALAAFDDLGHNDKRDRLDKRAEVQRAARAKL